MSGHNVSAVRHSTGWLRWWAECPDCPYREAGKSKQHAEFLADDHHRDTNCTCYDQQSMEFAPDPCNACQRSAS